MSFKSCVLSRIRVLVILIVWSIISSYPTTCPHCNWLSWIKWPFVFPPCTSTGRGHRQRSARREPQRHQIWHQHLSTTGADALNGDAQQSQGAKFWALQDRLSGSHRRDGTPSDADSRTMLVGSRGGHVRVSRLRDKIHLLGRNHLRCLPRMNRCQWFLSKDRLFWQGGF